MKKESKYLSTSEVADILGISRVAVFKKVKKGVIPAQKVGRSYVIARNDISSALEDTTTLKEKKLITNITGSVIEEYEEALRRLAKE